MIAGIGAAAVFFVLACVITCFCCCGSKKPVKEEPTPSQIEEQEAQDAGGGGGGGVQETGGVTQSKLDAGITPSAIYQADAFGTRSAIEARQQNKSKSKKKKRNLPPPKNPIIPSGLGEPRGRGRGRPGTQSSFAANSDIRSSVKSKKSRSNSKGRK